MVVFAGAEDDAVVVIESIVGDPLFTFVCAAVLSLNLDDELFFLIRLLVLSTLAILASLSRKYLF